MATALKGNSDAQTREEKIGSQMSFLEHIDELRKRLTRSILFVGAAFCLCWYFSMPIFEFLSVPVIEAISEAQNRQVELQSVNGKEEVKPLSELKEGDSRTYVFLVSTRLGITTVPAGTTIKSIVRNEPDGKSVLYTDEELVTDNTIIPKGVKLPVNLQAPTTPLRGVRDNLIVTTAMEPFTLYLTVSLYAAIALSVPFLLLQIWGFISPGLYDHEKSYVTPFVLLSSISFVCGMSFAYYILFPAAAKYLLGVGQGFQLLLKATDYFDFIIFVMLAMGGIFQMPAVTYILARIGIVSAKLLIKSWKIAIISILIASAVISPTGDALNMMLFAAPMAVLYLISIFIAWVFGRKREIPN